MLIVYKQQLEHQLIIWHVALQAILNSCYCSRKIFMFQVFNIDKRFWAPLEEALYKQSLLLLLLLLLIRLILLLLLLLVVVVLLSLVLM